MAPLTEAIPGFPWVLERPLPQFEGAKELAQQAVLEEFTVWQPPSNGYNFKVQSGLPFFREIYDVFLATCHETFAPFTLRKNNWRGCHAYVQNRERFASVWHDHRRTASINGVYYLAVPDTAGAIRFQYDDQELELVPTEGSLYLFPRWLVHRPIPQHSEAWRISLNVELLTNEAPVTRDGRSWNDHPVLDAIDGVSVAGLMERFGSPLFVLSERNLVRRHQELTSAFRTVDPRVVLAWSMATNPLAAVSRILQRSGARVEVARESEYCKARHLGFGSDEIVVNGPVKPLPLVERAITDGAALHVESLSDLALIERTAARLDRRARIALRISPRIPQMAGSGRFGFDHASGAASAAAYQVLGSSHLTWCGLACYLERQSADPNTLRDAVAALGSFDRFFHDRRRTPLEYIELGGFGSRTPTWSSLGDSKPQPPDLDAYASAVREGLVALGPNPPRLVLEIGHALIDPCGTFVATARVRKRLADQRIIVSLDGGLDLLPFGLRHTVRPTVERWGPSSPTLITGPTSMEEDVLADEADFLPVEEGDALAFLNAGAVNPLWWPHDTDRPAVVLIGPDGQFDVVRDAETFESVTERERIPERLR